MNLLKRAAFSFLFFFWFLSVGSATDKGLKALAAKKYDKAYEVFTETLEKDPGNVVASYGLSKLFSLKDFNQYDIEKAYVHLINTKEAYKQLDDKARKKLFKTEVQEENILKLQQVIDSVAFQNAILANNPEALETFINIHKTSPKLEDAHELKSQLEYLIVQKVNTYQAYADYLKKYPKSKKIKEAKQKYDLLLYENLTANGNVEAFKNFLEVYPDSPYREEAAKKLEILEFKALLKENSLAGYEEFVQNSPDGKFRKMAEDSIYARFTSFPSINEYENFIRKHPANRNIRDAWEKLYVLYNDSGTPEAFESFKARYPDYKEPYQLENDIELSNFGMKMLNQNFKGFKPEQIDAYITLAAPTEQSIAVLKLRIKPFLDTHQYQKAIDLLEKYQPYFSYKSFRIASWIETLRSVKENYQANKVVSVFTLN